MFSFQLRRALVTAGLDIPGTHDMGWCGLTVISFHLLQLLLVVGLGVPSLRPEDIGVRTKYLRVTMGYPSVDAHYCLLYHTSSAICCVVQGSNSDLLPQGRTSPI